MFGRTLSLSTPAPPPAAPVTPTPVVAPPAAPGSAPTMPAFNALVPADAPIQPPQAFVNNIGRFVDMLHLGDNAVFADQGITFFSPALLGTYSNLCNFNKLPIRIDLSGNNLPQENVDAILQALVGSNGEIDLSGGTTAAPDDLDRLKALQSDGWTVRTN